MDGEWKWGDQVLGGAPKFFDGHTAPDYLLVVPPAQKTSDVATPGFWTHGLPALDMGMVNNQAIGSRKLPADGAGSILSAS